MLHGRHLVPALLGRHLGQESRPVRPTILSEVNLNAVPAHFPGQGVLYWVEVAEQTQSDRHIGNFWEGDGAESVVLEGTD